MSTPLAKVLHLKCHTFDPPASPYHVFRDLFDFIRVSKVTTSIILSNFKPVSFYYIILTMPRYYFHHNMHRNEYNVNPEVN